MSHSPADTGQISRLYRQNYLSSSGSRNLAYHGEQTWPSSANCPEIHPAHLTPSIAPYSTYGNLSNDSRLGPQISLPPAGSPQLQYSHQGQAITYVPVQRTQPLQNYPVSYIASSSAMAGGEACQQVCQSAAQRIPPGENHPHVGSIQHIPIEQPAGFQMEVLLNEMLTDMQQLGGNMQLKFANVYQHYRDALAAFHHTRQEKQQVVSELNELRNSAAEMRNIADYWKKKWEDSENKRMATERQVAEALDSLGKARAENEAHIAEKQTWAARFVALLKYTKMLYDTRKCDDRQTPTVEVEAESNTTKPAEHETKSPCLSIVKSDGHITGDPSFCMPTVDTVEDPFDTCSPNFIPLSTRCATSQSTTEYVGDEHHTLQTTSEQDMIPACDGEHYPLHDQGDNELAMELQYPSGEWVEPETLGSHVSSLCEGPNGPSEGMTTSVAIDTHVKIEDPGPSKCSLKEERHGQRLGFEHINLLCHQTTKGYVCRLCIIQLPDKPPMTFPFDSSHDWLITHCEDEHPMQCDYIASLSEEQLIEAQNRLNSVSP